MRWTFVGALLSQESSGDLGPNRVVERPKVIYNSNTGTYVLWMHIDDSSYGEAKVGVATSSSVCGKYNYLGSWQPLGYQSRDMTLFQDSDGSAYLMSEDVCFLPPLSFLCILSKPRGMKKKGAEQGFIYLIYSEPTVCASTD